MCDYIVDCIGLDEDALVNALNAGYFVWYFEEALINSLLDLLKGPYAKISIFNENN